MELNEGLGFVRARNHGVLTTIRANGRPQMSNIVYVLGDDDLVRISITDCRAKTENMRRDPRGSLYVPGDSFFQYVVLEARPSSPGGGRPARRHGRRAHRLLRAGNGEHPDWDDYRAAMVADGRLVSAAPRTGLRHVVAG